MAGGKGGKHLRESSKRSVEKEALVETFKDLNFSVQPKKNLIQNQL